MASEHKIQLPAEIRAQLSKFTADIHVAQDMGEMRKYPDFVNQLFKDMENPIASLHHATTGLAGEGGEILDCTKKSWVYNKDLDVSNLIEELGDIRFYYQQILNMLDITDDEIQSANIGKLMQRYPDGVYTDKDAQARLDKAGE